jgi:hypothetical protein
MLVSALGTFLLLSSIRRYFFNHFPGAQFFTRIICRNCYHQVPLPAQLNCTLETADKIERAEGKERLPERIVCFQPTKKKLE